MTDVGSAGPSIQVWSQGVLRYFGVIAGIAWYNGRSIGNRIQHFGEGIGNLRLETIGKSPLELHKTAVVNGVRPAIEKGDTAKCRIRTRRPGRAGMAQISHRPALRRGARQDCLTDQPGCRLRGEQVDVASSRQVRAVNSQIANRHARCAA